MLVLSRKLGESVVIQGRIAVKVLGIRGGTVRLGIEAPRDIAILRKELVSGSAERADSAAEELECEECPW